MIDLERFMSARFVEHYSWYDGPLFYTIESEGKLYALYMIDDRNEIKTEFLIPLTPDELELMKKAPIRTWLFAQMEKRNLYSVEINYTSEPYQFRIDLIIDTVDKEDWFPSVDWKIDEDMIELCKSTPESTE